MKYIIYIFIFISFCFSVKAQQRWPSGFPTQKSTGWFEQGYQMSDSGTIVANRDTTWLAKYSGTIVYRPTNKQFYYFDSTTLRWYQLIPTAIDTTSLSNRINLKLNISDTASMLTPYLRKVDTLNKWVQNVYARNDSLFKLKNGTETFVHIFPTSGSGTVTSVALSMPAAFTVSGSPITTSGTFNVSGAGTSSQYIRGDGTLATMDTSAIPNFFSKVRSEFSGTSPITYNSTTGIFGILNANASGQKGAATFNNSDFTDNGSALISLAPIGSGGSCLNCQLTIDTKGRITSFADGSIFLLSNAPGAGDTLVVSGDTIKRIYASYGLISTPTASSIALRVDTTLIQKLITANNGLTKIGNNIQLGGALIQATNITSAVGANRIIYSGISSFGDGAQLDVSTTGSAGIGVRGQTTDGRGIFGVATTGVGVYGTATGSGGYGLFGLSTLGNAIYGRADSGIVWEGEMVPHSNNTIIPARSTTRSSQSLGANGIGYSDDSYIQTSIGGNQLTNRIIYKLTNATDATYASSFEFWNANNATLARKMAIAGNGQMTFDQYTGTNFQTIDTSFNSLVVDGSGNIFKRAGDGGSAITGGALPNQVTYWTSSTSIGGDSLSYFPTQNKLFTPKDFIQYGRGHVGFYTDTTSSTTSGYLWQLYPKFSSGSPGSPLPSGIDTLQPFFSEINTAKYDPSYLPNPVYTLVQFGRPNTRRPMASIRLEQDFFNATEYHVLSTIPRTMANPNEEIRHQSFYISQIDGQSQLQYQIGQSSWAQSQVGSDYNRPYAVLSPAGLNLTTFGNASGSISLVNGINPANQIGVGLLADTINHIAALYGTSNDQALYIGSTSGGTGIDIGNPSISGSDIRIYKFTRMQGKELRIENVPNSVTAFSITTPPIGFVQSVNIDGSGFANMTTTGTSLINRDPGISTSTRMLGIYNNYNPNDSIFHVYGNGNGYFKGIITARADSTTSATGGFLYRDAATGNFRITSSPSVTTLYTGDGTLAGNRTVTGSNNNLTFATIGTYRINSAGLVLDQNATGFPYSGVVIATGAHNFQLGYTPTTLVYTKGAGLYIDTNNNVGLGVSVPTTAPMYSSGGTPFFNGLQNQGANFNRVDSITTSVTLNTSEYFIRVDASGGAITLTLPAASSVFGSSIGIVYKIQKIDASGNAVTISRSGANTINGATSQTISTQYDIHEVQCTSTTTWAYK